MVLWQTTSYRKALDEEARLRRTRTQLSIRYGRRWKRNAPADLVWMLNIPAYAEEAHARVEAMIDKGADVNVESEAPQPRAEPGDVQGTEGHLEEALKINEEHWAQRARPASAETLRKHLRVGASKARELTATVRAMDRTTLETTNTERSSFYSN